MSQSIFPTLITSSFIPQLWKFTTGFTREYADLHYVKFPIAQGSQSFPLNLNVTGITTLGETNLQTKNSTQNLTHYLNFSDSSSTGVGAIQKSANFSVNPSTGIFTTSGLRISNSPMIAYQFGTSTQSIFNNSLTDVLYPTADLRNGTLTGLSYAPATGIFTNSNAYSITLTVSASVSFANNTTGIRVIWIETSGQGRIGLCSLNTILGDPTACNITLTFVLNTTETFKVRCYQNCGGSLNIGGSTDFPSRVSVLVL
jgi:hypothetical protein